MHPWCSWAKRHKITQTKEIPDFSFIQGDIELLQFADKPDAAYDMCVSITPNCTGAGYGSRSGYGSGIAANVVARDRNTGASTVIRRTTERQNVRQNYETTTHGDLYTLNANGDRRRPHFGRRFYNTRNRTDNLLAAASRGLTTIRPDWQITNSYAITGQHPTSTDSGNFEY